MCMEDVRIGRKTNSFQKDFIATNTSANLLSGSDYRTCIIFNPLITGNITYSLQITAVLNQGITLGAGQKPITLTIVEHGDMVRRPWAVISDQATENCSVMFTELAAQ